MTILHNRWFRLHVAYLPFGRKFYLHKSEVRWGHITQLGLYPFVFFLDRFR